MTEEEKAPTKRFGLDVKVDEGYAWVVVAASFCGSFLALGCQYAMGATFFLAWLEEWPLLTRAELSSVVSVVYIMLVSGAPIWGLVIKRLGRRLGNPVGR